MIVALPDTSASQLRIHLLGGLRLQVGDCTLPGEWRLRRSAHLVAMLALAPDYRLHREHLLDALWPNLGPVAAGNNLAQAVMGARRAIDPVAGLGRSCFRRDGETLLLRPPGGLWVDVEAFATAVAAARTSSDPQAHRAAVALYAGDLLPEEPYADWASGRRETVRQAYVEVLLALARLHLQRGEPGLALTALSQLIATAPAHEAAHRLAMTAYHHLGQTDQAMRQYDALREALARELDATPDAVSQCLYEDIVSDRHRASDARDARVPTAASDQASPPRPAAPEPPRAPMTNVPHHLTSFIGRDREVAEVVHGLSATRLVTLTGSGGIGKTRLAQEVARTVAGEYPDGVWLVALAALADGELVPTTVARALGVAEQPGRRPTETLTEVLGTRRLLLVLDNCEHLVAACARLADALLAACPRLCVLATSREPLRVGGELEWRVPSLALPDPAQPAATELTRSEAAQLFVARAAFARPGFAITAANAAAVVEICHRLDGIPLALELAAARLRVLTVEQIATRLDDQLHLLTGGSRTSLPRQQTLLATLNWSHDLLTAPERALFRRLAVFVGGFTLEAAEAVGAGDGTTDWQVLDLLTRLIEQSLVVAEAGDEIRYRLLETVRQYAGEKLAASGEAAAARDRHATWCGALAARAAPEIGGPDQGAWFDRLEAEHDNLRAALGWVLEADAAAGLALATDLGDFWLLCGYETEGIQWLTPVLAATPDRTVARARALLHLAQLTRYHEGHTQARALDEEALAICREVGDASGEAWALACLGNMAATTGDLAAARVLLEESLALERAQGDRRRQALRLRELGLIHATGGELEQARALFEESLALARATGAAQNAGFALVRLGILDRLEGDYARSRSRVAEGLALVEAVRFAPGVLGARNALANLARAEGRFEEAGVGLRAGLRDLLTGQVGFVPNQLVQVGILAVAEGDYARGVRLIAVQPARSGVIGSVHSPDVRLEGEAALARARALLGDDAFAAAWAAGQALPLEEAIAEALADAPTD